MIKVTAVHYLNKRLKPSSGVGLYKNEPAYPVYIRISFMRKNQRIKSHWIRFDATEREFEEDKRIQEIIKYEEEIIQDIFREQEDESDFDVGTKLDFYLDDMIDNYWGWVLLREEIAEPLLEYIIEKTGLNRNILNPYISYDNIMGYSAEDLYILIDKDFYSPEIKNKIIYAALLLEYESVYYKKGNTFEYKVGETFTYHEWKNKGGKKHFVQFATGKQNIDRLQIIEITEMFDMILRKKIHENWIIVAEPLRNE